MSDKTIRDTFTLVCAVVTLLLVSVNTDMQYMLVKNPLHQFAWVAAAYPCMMLGCALIFRRFLR